MKASLPKGWVETTLGDIAIVIQGQSPPGDSYNDRGEGMPFFQGKAEFGELFPTIKKWCTKPKKVACPGDVLISIRAPVGPTNLAIVRCAIGRGLAGIRPMGQIPSRYILHYLRHSSLLLASQATGSTFKAVSGVQLREHPVALPPLPEQHRIVEVIESYLSRLDAAIAALERVKKNLERYRKSVLKAAVEGRLVPTEAELARKEGRDYEPASVLLERILEERRKRWEEAEWKKIVERAKQKAAKEHRKKAGRPLKRGEKLAPEEWRDIPETEYRRFLHKSDKWKEKYKEPAPPNADGLPELREGWCWATMPQLGELNRGKSKHRPRNDPRLLGGPYPFIQTGDIRHADGFIREYKDTYSEFGLAQSRLWPAGTLCITIAANIAETGILTFDACFPDSVVGFLNKEEPTLTRFIELFLRTAKEELDRYAPATAQKNINLAVLSELAVPVPPALEQSRIITEVDRLLSVSTGAFTIAEHSIRRANRLRQSILKWAFEGKLVDQDPNDEPASELLKRIKAEREEMEKEKKEQRKRRRGKKMAKKKKRHALVDVLREAESPLSPEDLFSRAGFTADFVESFYEELRREVQTGRVLEERPDKRTVKLRLGKS